MTDYNLKEKKRFVVIDGNHLIHRAFYAIQNPLKTSSGEQTNAIYGFSSMVLNIIERDHPDYIAMTFYERAPTFRHEAHKEYKGTRKKTPDELHAQVPRIREMVKRFNMPSFSKEGFEADDMMGTLSKKAEADNIETNIVTGDMDMLQLINDNIIVTFPHKGYKEPTIFNAKKVYDKYQIHPDQVVDYKAMVGDSSDNIKGIDGIGPKGASDLLDKYKTLDGIYDHLDDIASKNMRNKLINDRDAAYFAKSLATIVVDVPCEFNKEDAELSKLDFLGLLKFFEEMEMRSLQNRLKKMIPADRLMPEAQMSMF